MTIIQKIQPGLNRTLLAAAVLILVYGHGIQGAVRTEKPILHGRHWVAITGKPMAATAGAMMFMKGGNAVDAACAMLGAVCTMHDVLSWGGETQALIYNPKTGEVIAVNALGVAPTGATPEFYKERDMKYPPADGPLSAVTPGTPGGLLTMLAEFGTLSLADVLEPSLQMAEGYPMEKDTADRIERTKDKLKEWPYSKAVFLPHLGEEEREAPYPGEVFRQPDLAETLKNSSKPKRMRCPEDWAEKRPFTPHTNASTAGTSPASSSAAPRNRAGSSPWRTSTAGRSILKNR
jgi:gamma-glutamyltranspeptidase / glutathione hydrolase